MKRIEVTSNIIYLFIGILYCKSNDKLDYWLADKRVDCIERNHQDSKRLPRRFQGVTDYIQFQTSQIRLYDVLTNPIFLNEIGTLVNEKVEQSSNIYNITV